MMAMMATFITTLAVAFIFANPFSEDTYGYLRANSNELWNHYNGVPSTFEKKGIKEYWISCNSHEIVFSAPASDNIHNQGTPSDSFINSLADNDSRLLKRTWQPLSFATASDADKIFSVRNNFAIKQIVDDSYAPDYDGKVLKLTFKDGTADFMLNEAYLDQVFGNTSVTALEFNAKVDSTTNYKDVSYRSQATTIRYEGNGAAQFGFNTTWKTFSYPRSAYEAFKNDPNKATANRNTFLWNGVTYATFELYLDNFHPVTRTLDWTGFEQGRHNTDAKYFSYRQSSGEEVFYAMSENSSTVLNWTYDETIKSEGGRSVKISRAASENVYFGLRRDVLAWDTLLPNSSSNLSFDFRSSSTLNCNASVSSILICQNTKLSSGTNFQIPKDTWVRIVIPKSKIDRNIIFSFSGGAVCDFWVDNIQFNTDSGCFEDETLMQTNLNNWTYNGEYVNANNHTNVDYAAVRTLRITGANGNVRHVGVSNLRKSEGNKSLWVDVINGSSEVAFYLSSNAKTWLTNNVNSTVSFDIYRTSTGALNACTNGNREALAQPASNTWKHYDLSASDLTADGRFYIIQGSAAIGDWYIDNIQYEAHDVLEDAINTSVLNRDIYVDNTSNTTFFPTNRVPTGVSGLVVDGDSASGNNISSFDSTGLYVSNSYLSTLDDGEHKMLITYYSHNRIVTETFYQNVYYGTLKSAISVSTSYGSADYYTLPDTYTNLYRIVTADGKDVPFERMNGGNTYSVPHASLVEALPTVDGYKSSGSITLFIFTIDQIYRLPVTVNISKTAVKSITNYNDDPITSFYYSSTQHAFDNSEYETYLSLEKLNEYFNGKNDIIYEQHFHVGANHNSLTTQMQYLLNNANTLGKKVILSDDAFTLLGREESSLIGRDITLGSSTVHFNNTTELDSFVTNRLNLYINHPACYGVNVGDEETYNQLVNGYSDLMHSIHRCLTALNREDFYVNCNLQPMSASALTMTGNESGSGNVETDYRTYLEAYVAASGNDYISYDYYPLGNGNSFGGVGVGPYVLRSLVLVAKVAKEHGLKVHVVTQTYSFSHSSNTLILNSEDVSYLNNMLMAFGVKQICYFTFYHRGDTGSETWNANGCVMTSDGVRNDLYYYMQAQRAQIQEMGPILGNFNFEWFYITRASSSSNRLISHEAYTYLYSNRPYATNNYQQLKSFGNPSKAWTSLTGLYNSVTGEYMYTAQNLYRKKDQSSTSQTVELRFDASVNYFAIYENGSVRIVYPSKDSYSRITLTLSSGHTAFIIPYI